MTLAKEGLPIIIPVWSAIVALSAYAFISVSRSLQVVAGVLFLMGLFVLWFFRDPIRDVPDSPDLIVSPADGKVVEIVEEEEPNYIKGKAVRVSIFLSVFNVHVNRFPKSGTVHYYKYNPGKFLAAWEHKASLENEQTCVGFECENGVKMVVKQIAGLIARRIVCYADSGTAFSTGQRFGLIRFGSRTDIFVPVGTDLNIKVGDKVKGGSSVIGKLQ